MPLAAAVCVLLSQRVSFLVVAAPPRSRRTFAGLSISATLSPEGWDARAIGAISREAHRTTWNKLIERAQVPVGELAVRLLQLVQKVFPSELVNPIIDDTPVPRCAKAGQGIGIEHEHSHKANRPTFLTRQCRVTLALVVRRVRP